MALQPSAKADKVTAPVEPTPDPPAVETPEVSVEERLGKRGHEAGNVRPADGRYGLHDPDDESKVVRNTSPRRGK